MTEPLTFRRALIKIPQPAAAWTALIFVWFSFRPSLLPRDAVTQGVVTALSAALGLGLGTLAAASVRKVLDLLKMPVPKLITAYRWQVFGISSAVVAIVGLIRWLGWQNDQRDLVTMDHLAPASALVALAVAVIVTIVFVAIGRIVSHPVRLLDRVLCRKLPIVAARSIGVVVTVLIAVFITRDVVIQWMVNSVNSSYSYVDTTTDEDIHQPIVPTSSGGPGSLVRWDDLGNQGRTFAGSATSIADLQGFAGPDAQVMDPIRAYAGLRSADSAEARADLAVQELERTGAFDREVLAVVTVTGTGWINPDAARGLELMHGGNTAMVAIQYSYLPSWISFLVDLDKASESGAALFEAVHERWEALPVDARPRLVVYGESLGSFGSEEAFARPQLDESISNTLDQTDGVIWVGPTFANPIWQQVVAGREPSSPTWFPTLGEDSRVEVLGRPDDPYASGHGDGKSRVVYLTHPSDPVTWANIDTLWTPPKWMDSPVGYDVSGSTQWFPGVTLIQSLFDLMAGFSAPAGHGHDYRPSLASGWASVVAPDGWTAADTERLQATIDAER